MSESSVSGSAARPRGARRRGAIAAVATLAVAVSASVAVSDAGGAAARGRMTPRALHAHRRAIHAGQLRWRPSRAATTQTWIVRLAADPAAVVAARATEDGHPLSGAARRATSTRAAQSAARVTTALHTTRTPVLRRYSHTINGFAVRTDASGAAALRRLADVAAVTPTRRVHLDNTNSNAFTQTPQVWDSTGFTGAGQKIAVIDTGIDYTHADFGGSGDPADFTANDGTVVEPGSFPTAKVIGGHDFVGDAYDADTPVPDADPLDCNGHGSHVAGTAAGYGVLADGSTYHGPYTSAAVAAQSFRVAPGAAPLASLMAYRVFGCDGSANTDVIVAAIDQAVADGATVINMSLGSVYGRADDPDALASDAAMLAGTMVVNAAGNEGPSPYMVGGPATSSRSLAVSAVDAVASFPGATVDPDGLAITAIDANDSTSLPVTAPLHVVPDGSGGISQGCGPDEFDAATVGTIAVVERGTCARVDKPANAEAAGAVGVIMVNNADGLPPFEGAIAGVTVPFLGIDPADADSLATLDGQTITIAAAGAIDNPSYAAAASFTSAGPRSGDGAMKPEVAAPGVSVFSANVGSGSEAQSLSGTSMATPHTAGVAALVRQAHPGWSPRLVKAAMVGTSDAAKLVDFDRRISGNGALSTPAAVRTRQVLVGAGGDVAANFYWREHLGAYNAASTLALLNGDKVAHTYSLATMFDGDSLGAAVSVSPKTVTVPAHGQVSLTVRYSLSAAAARAVPVDLSGGLTTISGSVSATSADGGAPLHVPFLAVPRPRSAITATKTTDTMTVRNTGLLEGIADVYSWVLYDGPDAGNRADARALGIQYLDPGDGSGDVMTILSFSVRSHLSNPAEAIYDSYFDTNNDGTPDYEVFGADDGLVFADDPNGILDTFVIDLATEDGFAYDAFAPTDGSIAQLGFFASDLGIHDGDAPAEFIAGVQDLAEGAVFDDFDGSATYSPFDPQTSQGDFVPLVPGQQETFPIGRRAPHRGERRALGWMVVGIDDRAGSSQADLLAG